MAVNGGMDYSDPPRRQRPSRYPGLVPNEDRRAPAGRSSWDAERVPWDDEPYPASPAAYPDTFNGAPADTFSAGFTDAFSRAPADAMYQPPATGAFSQASSADGLRLTADGPSKPRRSAVEWLAGAVAGFLAAAVAIGVANLTAAFVRPQASPIIAVGEAFIDRTPPALKNFAVEKFGENDKNMLLLGMYVTIALIAIVIGMIAWRRVYVGVAGIGLFGLFGAFVAFTRPESHPTDVIPSIIGGIAGIAAIYLLVREGNRRTGYGSRAPDTWPGYPGGWAA